jgi:hypothetical protein
MNLLFYASVDNRDARKIFEIMQLLEKEVSLEFYRNISLFMKRLRQPAKDLAAVVIFAANMEDLDDIRSVRHFLEDIPVILVLPENGEEYIRKGHLLRPRFLTFAENGQREIGAVLNNMLQKASVSTIQQAGVRRGGISSGRSMQTTRDSSMQEIWK